MDNLSQNTRIALILAMIWAIVKMVLFMTNKSELGFKVGVISMFLFIITACALSLWTKYKSLGFKKSGRSAAELEAKTDGLSDFTHTAKAGFTYVLAAVAFMFVYYQFIDTQYLPERANRLVMEKQEWIEQPGILEQENALLDEQQQFENTEEYIEKYREQTDFMHSKKIVVGLGLTVWVFITMISALFVTLLFRMVLLK